MRKHTHWLVVCGSLLLAACSDPTDFGESGGRLLASRIFSRPAWSPDGRTIYFTDRAGGGVTEIRVHALNVETGRTRQLAAVTGMNHGEFVRTGPDLATVFVSIAKPSFSLQSTVYRVPADGGPAESVVSNVGIPRFVISTTGNHVAYRGSMYDADSIYVSTTSVPSVMVAMPSVGRNPNPIGISHDGQRVLYASSSGIYKAQVNRGTHQHLMAWSAFASTFDVPPVRWEDAVPHLLIADSSTSLQSVSLFDVNGDSGHRTLVATVPRALNQLTYMQLAQSHDGALVAAWLPIAVTNQNVERTTFRFRLYIKAGPGSEMTASLGLEADEPPVWFEFAPDGRHIALLVQGSLYVIPVSKRHIMMKLLA